MFRLELKISSWSLQIVEFSQELRFNEKLYFFVSVLFSFVANLSSYITIPKNRSLMFKNIIFQSTCKFIVQLISFFSFRVWLIVFFTQQNLDPWAFIRLLLS